MALHHRLAGAAMSFISATTAYPRGVARSCSQFSKVHLLMPRNSAASRWLKHLRSRHAWSERANLRGVTPLGSFMEAMDQDLRRLRV
jgi:hypothetical protein